MSQARRIGYAIKVTIAMAVTAIVHFRFGTIIYEMAKTDFSGPFSGSVETLEAIVPVTIAAILLATWAWVFFSPAREERVRSRQPPR